MGFYIVRCIQGSIWWLLFLLLLLFSAARMCAVDLGLFFSSVFSFCLGARISGSRELGVNASFVVTGLRVGLSDTNLMG